MFHSKVFLDELLGKAIDQYLTFEWFWVISFSILCTGSSGLVADYFKKTCQSKHIPFYGLDLHGEGDSIDITNYENLKTKIQQLSFQANKPILFHFAAITLTGENLTAEQTALSKSQKESLVKMIA